MNAMYEKAGEGFLTRKMDWVGDEFCALLVTKDYVADFVNHAFVSDIPRAVRVAVSPPLKGKSVAGFLAKAQNIRFERLNGPKCEAMIVFHNTAKEGTSRLVTYVDEATFLPHLPNGGDLDVKWDGSAIFSI